MLRLAAVLASLALAAPASAAPKQPGPLEVTRAFYKALHAGDARAAARHVTPGERPALASFVRLAQAHRRLEAAVAKRFGREAASTVGYGNKVQEEVKALLGARARIVDDRALVVTAVGETLATLHQVEGAWLLELDDALATEPGRARIAREAAAAEAAEKVVAKRLAAGKYRDAELAVRDFQEALAVRAEAEPPRGVERPDEPGDGGADL